MIGGAACIWEDYGALGQLIKPCEVSWWIAINDVGAHWPGKMDAWVTLHPEKLAEADPDDPAGLSWIERRRANNLDGGYTTYARRRPDLIHERVEHWGGGSSGLYGVRVACHLGAERTLLLGMPLDSQDPFPESLSSHTVPEHLEGYRRGWERKLSRPESEAGIYLRESVRSFSGWTRQVLGAPTEAWLKGED